MQNAFTLIELLVVVLIIGILSAVALPQYQKAVKKSKITEMDVNIGVFSKAIDVWLLANDYPQHWTYFTGDGSLTTEYYSGLDVELPGKTDVIGNFSKLGRWQLICSSSYCMIYLQTTYNADGTQGNPWLNGATLSVKKYPNSYSSQWVLSQIPTNTVNKKLICQWWESNYGTARMEDAIKTACAS